MFDNWTVARRLTAGFGFAGLTLLVIAAIAYRTTSDLIENNDQVSHTHLVRTEFVSLLSGLQDAETGQRGYVITGIDSYLDPYRSSLTNIRVALEDLRKLTADNPNQQHRLALIEPLIDAKLTELKRIIDLRGSVGVDAAVKEVSTGAGKSYMDQMRTLIAAADKEEVDLLRHRDEAAKLSARWTMAIIMWGGALGTAVVAAIGWFIIRSLSGEIGGAVGQIQSSSAELQAAATQQATGSKQQAMAMAEITSTINELLATSRQIAESARRVAMNADQTADAARSGHGTVDTTQDSISAIRNQVDQIVTRMLELGRKSQEIGAVLEIVSELAEQTNILAINATIEAAGAGDAGRRFAVVADEIRKLADRVGGSTKEIRTLIDDVRSAVNATVMATETGSKTVDSGLRLFGDVTSAFRRISGLVTAATEAAREIELSTKQQSTAVEQVNVAIVSVAQASRETESSSGQTLTTASQLAGLSRDLLRIIRPQAAA